MGNDGVNAWDYLGMEVYIVFNRSTGTVIVTDRDTNTVLIYCGESGGRPWGDPIPLGSYEILERAGRAEYFRLDAMDSDWRNDVHEPTGRDRFRLHGPGMTVGCISATGNCATCWSQAATLIENTSTINVEVESHRRFDSIRGPAIETIKRYGVLEVIETSSNPIECECDCPEESDTPEIEEDGE